MQAICINRSGDAALTVALIAIAHSAPDLSYDLIAFDAQTNSSHMLCGIALTLAAAAKSAQLGLHTWLPNAIEAPTPVSALIHAATLVTAGVYLLARSTALLDEAALAIIQTLGALTVLYGSYTAIIQTDLKRIVAYSTCSQIGYLVTGIGLSIELSSMSHIVAHAHFKALLFLTAGAVLHSMSDLQDLRLLATTHMMPLISSAFVVGSATIVALPSTDAYYTKDLFIETSLGAYAESDSIADQALLIGAMLTAYYSYSTLVDLTSPKTRQIDLASGHDTDKWTELPLVALMTTSLLMSWLSQDMYSLVDNYAEPVS